MKTFTSLAQFYMSEEWRGVRAALISERVNPRDGILYDEHSGEPLINGYDIVAHHKKPLTMQNVNDYSISLNPENIMLVSHRSHNEIHARYGFMVQKKVYYVWGAPCSGKSTFVRNSKGNSDFVVDVDLIWQAVTGGALYEKPDALKSNVFAIRDAMLDQVKTRAGKWERAWIIEGGALRRDRSRRISVLGAEGIFIECDKETCLQRLASDDKRDGVRDAWRGFIDDWFEKFEPEENF